MSIKDLRETLAAAAEGVLEQQVAVYRSAVDAQAVFPAVVLGMPSWRPVTGTAAQWEFPVAVVVDRSGASDSSTVEQLDDLWPTVLGAFLDLRDTGEITDVTKAEFGMFNVQGQDYPAQVLTCTLTTNC